MLKPTVYRVSLRYTSAQELHLSQTFSHYLNTKDQSCMICSNHHAEIIRRYTQSTTPNSSYFINYQAKIHLFKLPFLKTETEIY